MNIKNRGRLVCLYRSSWVRRGQVGNNTHGYALQSYVASLPSDAQVIPQAVAALLTAEEIALVERRICEPARAAAQRAGEEAACKEADPAWRLAEARRLVEEALERSRDASVAHGLVQPIAAALARFCTTGADHTASPSCLPDPLSAALAAVRSAAAGVRAGALGPAPKTGARSTATYALWADIVAEVEGTVPDSLLEALQSQGFVRRRRS